MEYSSPNNADPTQKNLQQFSVQELIQILLSEDKSKKYLEAYQAIRPAEFNKAERQREKVLVAIKQNGFEYFIDRLIEKQVYLSPTVRTQIELYLTSQATISTAMRTKVF